MHYIEDVCRVKGARDQKGEDLAAERGGVTCCYLAKLSNAVSFVHVAECIAKC